MISLAAAVKIHVCVAPTDLRKGFDGLCGLAEHVLRQDPLSGHLFVFRNRKRDRLKVLYWDHDGLALWLEKQDLLPKSLIGKAATYTRNQWTALRRYLDDGELSIDNNPSERTVKPVAIGRKNWLVVGSPRAGERAAILM